MNNSGKILTAVAVGIVAGAVLGILLAPDKGSETRKKINEESKKVADGVKEKFRFGKEKLSELKAELDRKINVRSEEIA